MYSILVEKAENRRIDFIINGIPHEGRTLQVYLAYSNAAGKADQWDDFSDSDRGKIELDQDSLQLLAGVTVIPAKKLDDFPETPLGSAGLKRESIILPVSLSDLSDFGGDGQSIYFQAVVIPVNSDGDLIWEEGYATEVDRFVINRTLESNPEFDKLTDCSSNSEGKGSDSDGKNSNSNGKNSDSGGK